MEKTRPHWVEFLVMVAGELVFAAIALALYFPFVLPKHADGTFPGFSPAILPTANPVLAALATIAAIAVSIGLVALLSRVFGAGQFKIDAVDELLYNYSTLDLVVLYVAAGFSEELLFRVVLQGLFGILAAAILFTAAHAAYWRKPMMLVHVFLVGLVMGLLYMYTGSLLLCAIAHAVYNLAVSLLMKAGKLPLDRGRLIP